MNFPQMSSDSVDFDIINYPEFIDITKFHEKDAMTTKHLTNELQITQNKLKNSQNKLETITNELEITKNQLQTIKYKFRTTTNILQITQNELQTVKDKLEATEDKYKCFTTKRCTSHIQRRTSNRQKRMKK